MSKYILSLFFLIPFCTQKIQADGWYPDATLFSKLDSCYADKEHFYFHEEDKKCFDCQEANLLMDNFNLAVLKYQMNNDPRLSAEQKEAACEQSEPFIHFYNKYLSVYLCCLSQLSETDKSMIEYLSTLDVKGFLDAFAKQYFPDMQKYEVLEFVEQFLPVELFICWVVFMSDEHLQQEVEKYIQQNI